MTTKRAAELIGVSARTIQGWCQRLHWHKDGRDYFIDEDRWDILCLRVQHKRGRPRRA